MAGSHAKCLSYLALCLLVPAGLVLGGNPDAKRLYDDLLSNYNKLVRPVVNVSEAVTVRLKLKLSQLIDVVSYFGFFHLNEHFFLYMRRESLELYCFCPSLRFQSLTTTATIGRESLCLSMVFSRGYKTCFSVLNQSFRLKAVS